ncbi:MAG: class I SAM-dependent RNA methyltransferase [Myxococcales bacterium]|nr:class I SAM-dependent RNA methyltransferase [Myxococcales bacterium]
MAAVELVATSAFGLESVVAHELEALGYGERRVADGRIAFVADEAGVCRTNLWLRAADRVLVKLGEFPARDFGALFEQTAALDWASWLPPNAAFPVRGKSVRSQLHAVPSCQGIVKKAIVESLRRAHRRERLPEDGPEYPVEVSLLRDVATLALDTSGPGLHKRGYRKLVGTAPLKETLAAALVLLSRWRPDEPLCDPLCGSGTIPIEAALIARHVAPGIGRSFAAERWPRIGPAAWQRAREEARSLEQRLPVVRIAGSDRDGEQLALARQHAQAAGVASDVAFERRELERLPGDEGRGLVLCNPPYGERLGDEQEVRALFAAMAAALERRPDWSLGMLTPATELEAALGRRAEKKRKLYNGRIACTYYLFRPARARGA